MIFKVNYGTYFRAAGNQNIYISLCDDKLNIRVKEFKPWLYTALVRQKIVHASYDAFGYDMPPTIEGRLIKCYVNVNNKNKLFCKLEQLLPNKPTAKRMSFGRADLSSNDHISFNTSTLMNDIIGRIERRSANIIQQMDQEVLTDLDRAVRSRTEEVAANIRQAANATVDYRSLVRRTLVTEALPEPAIAIQTDQEITLEAPAVEVVNRHTMRFDVGNNGWEVVRSMNDPERVGE